MGKIKNLTDELNQYCDQQFAKFMQWLHANPEERKRLDAQEEFKERALKKFNLENLEDLHCRILTIGCK